MGLSRRAAPPNERRAAASRAAAIANFAEDVAHRSKAAEVLGLILRHPVLVSRTARYVAALPQLSITLSRSPIGDDIAGKLQHSKLGLPTGRLAQSVIDVPPKVETYLSGRPRQALRTNLGHARRLGLTVERAPADADFQPTIDQVLRKREATDAEISRFHAEHPLYAGSWAYVVAMAGDPLLFMVLYVDDECAWLELLMIGERSKEALLARYAAYERVVADLGAAGIRYLLADSGLAVPDHVRYFQHLVGHRLVNLSIARSPE
jgi:hypothetical protein